MTEYAHNLPKGRQVRRVLHEGEWWFSVVDVAGALTDSPDAGAYWRKLKQRLTEEGSEVVTFCHGLKLPAPDGKLRKTDCAEMKDGTNNLHTIDARSTLPRMNRTSTTCSNMSEDAMSGH